MSRALEPNEVVAGVEGVLARGPLTFEKLNGLVDRGSIPPTYQLAAMTLDAEGRAYVGRREHLVAGRGSRNIAVALPFVSCVDDRCARDA